MREYSQHFGDSERLSLETTFRCADRIAAVATDFILRNPAQIKRRSDQYIGPKVHVSTSHFRANKNPDC